MIGLINLMTLIGVFVLELKVVLFVGILQFLICKYFYKARFIIPFFTAMYSFLKIFLTINSMIFEHYFDFYSVIMDLGFILIYSLPLVSTVIISLTFKNKIKQQEELNRMILQDL